MFSCTSDIFTLDQNFSYHPSEYHPFYLTQGIIQALGPKSMQENESKVTEQRTDKIYLSEPGKNSLYYPQTRDIFLKSAQPKEDHRTEKLTPITSNRKNPSRKHLRTKVIPDFHLTYSKNGGKLGSESK